MTTREDPPNLVVYGIIALLLGYSYYKFCDHKANNEMKEYASKVRIEFEEEISKKKSHRCKKYILA